jgi:hypothetical protein
MAITSTVPGAVATLAGYMTAAAAANPLLDAETYVGLPIGEVADNYLMVGEPDSGAVIVPGSYSWASMPVGAKRRNEVYALQATIRTWAGDIDPAARLNDAFALLNSLHEQIVSDPGGSGNLSPSGAWGALHVAMPANGPLDGMGGWGTVLDLQLHVLNVQLLG